MTQELPGTGAAAPAAPRQPRASPKERHTLTVLVLLLLALMGYSGMLEGIFELTPLAGVQDEVVAYLDSSETKAVEAFAMARTINAVVSILKSADLSAVVAQIAPMEILEPVDDLAKEFSDVMVVSIVAILVQRLTLLVSQAWAFSIVLPAGCLALACSFGMRRSPTMSQRLAALGRSLIMLSVFARLVILASGWVGESVTQRFLADDLNNTLSVLHASGGNIDQLTAKVAATEEQAASQVSPPASTDSDNATPKSVFDQVGGVLQSTADTTKALIGKGAALMNVVKNWMPDAASISALSVRLPGQIVKAIEIFLVQTIITPLLVAFIFYGVVRGIVRPVNGVPIPKVFVRNPVGALAPPT